MIQPKSDHTTLAQCPAKIPPRWARPPLLKGAIFGPPLWKRGVRGDFTASATMYESYVVRFRMPRFSHSPIPRFLPSSAHVPHQIEMHLAIFEQPTVILLYWAVFAVLRMLAYQTPTE